MWNLWRVVYGLRIMVGGLGCGFNRASISGGSGADLVDILGDEDRREPVRPVQHFRRVRKLERAVPRIRRREDRDAQLVAVLHLHS